MWRIWSVLCEKDAVTKGKRKVDSYTIYVASMELAGKKGSWSTGLPKAAGYETLCGCSAAPGEMQCGFLKKTMVILFGIWYTGLYCRG